mgnify:CR=1 FL=1
MKISPQYFKPLPSIIVNAVMEFDDKPSVKTFKLPYPTPSNLSLNRVTEFLFSSPCALFLSSRSQENDP